LTGTGAKLLREPSRIQEPSYVSAGFFAGGKANKGYSGSGGPKKIEDIDHCGCRAMFFLKLLDLVSKYAHVCQKIKALNYPRSRRVEWPVNGGVSVIFHTQARHLQSFPSSLHICSLQSFPSSFPSWWNMR